MGMDGVSYVVRRGAQRLGEGRFTQHFGHVGAHQMRPDQLVVGVEDELHETVAVARGSRLARCGEGESPYLILYSRLARLLFRYAHRRHFGRGEHARRDGRVVDGGGGESANMFDAMNGLGRRHMRQSGRGDYVAYGVNALQRGHVVFVHLDLVALDDDAALLQTHVLDVGRCICPRHSP